MSVKPSRVGAWALMRVEGRHNIRIDDPNHATLAVPGLRAVIPDGVGVVDRQDERCVLCASLGQIMCMVIPLCKVGIPDSQPHQHGKG